MSVRRCVDRSFSPLVTGAFLTAPEESSASDIDEVSLAVIFSYGFLSEETDKNAFSEAFLLVVVDSSSAVAVAVAAVLMDFMAVVSALTSFFTSLATFSVERIQIKIL